VDIASPAERGLYLGLFGLGPMLGPCFGPVIGGVLAGTLGWRSVFWFLVIAAGFWATLTLLFFPETLRTIVGDGSVPAPPWNRSLIPIVGRKRTTHDPEAVPEKSYVKNNPLEVLLLFRNVDVVLILGATAIPSACVYVVLTTLSTLFPVIYPWLSETEIGLCYLANGFGGVLGSLGFGKLLNVEWARAKRRAADLGEKEEGARDGVYVERARLRLSPIMFGLFSALIVVYGWVAAIRGPLPVLLILQFLIMAMTSGIFNICQSLLMDLFPRQGASITACNNAVRCLFGAAVVAVVEYIIDAIGYGWTYTILGIGAVLSYGLIIVEWKMGRSFRLRRVARLKKIEEKRAAEGK